MTPTASETATFTNFATRAGCFITKNIGAQDWIRTSTVSRHPLKVVRLPISPPGHCAKVEKMVEKINLEFLPFNLFFISLKLVQ
jgi:hypothetical protein